ncbi:hypothetical protein AVEN_95700-1 [Araneus ventricosus]|uniref:Uncharacterized protein n=1 Tax=Araneus ventricosus TaxID=182803 RepID=A0A4Y2UGQ1_ARAVE|nr:hypothetical protein AVEN_95700-1 [Araneus ventricosus]
MVRFFLAICHSGTKNTAFCWTIKTFNRFVFGKDPHTMNRNAQSISIKSFTNGHSDFCVRTGDRSRVNRCTYRFTDRYLPTASFTAVRQLIGITDKVF